MTRRTDLARSGPVYRGRGRTLLEYYCGKCEAWTDGWGEPEGLDPRALLRPRVRVRDHPGLPPPARAPDVGRCTAVPDSASRGVLVVELHDLDHQRTGYGDRPCLLVPALVLAGLLIVILVAVIGSSYLAPSSAEAEGEAPGLRKG
jgi:hypothetical protein